MLNKFKKRGHASLYMFLALYYATQLNYLTIAKIYIQTLFYLRNSIAND